MLVNNEFGSIYPVARVARTVRANAPNAALHVDAVQGLGKIPLSMEELGAHSLSISAHKIQGPKGAGALVLSKGIRPRPLVFGGDQEHGLRSGTENPAGIVGLGHAAELAASHVAEAGKHMRALRGLLRDELGSVEGIELLDVGDDVSPAICALLVPGPPAEVWMHHLEVRGIMTSVGSACQAKKGGVSPALRALGFDQKKAKQVLRISFSRETAEDDIRRAVLALSEVERALGAYK